MWKAQESVRECNFKWPVVQHLAKFDMWQQIFTGLKHTSAAAPLQYPKWKPQNSHLHTGYQNALLTSKDGQGNHLPRGLRAAATLSPTFLRKFTLGSSDGPEALILKNKNKDTLNSKHVSQWLIPVAVLSPSSQEPSPGALSQQPTLQCFPLSLPL